MSLTGIQYQSVSIIGIDGCYHLCIALLPVLCLLNIPFVDISLGTVMLLLFVPYLLIRIFIESTSSRPRVSYFFFFLFYFYMILRADGSATHIVMCVAAFIHLLGIACGTIETKKLRKYIEIYALINTGLIILQVLLYYILHYKLQILPQALFHSDFRDSYVFRNEAGLYRPSALFLEPSHFSQYCCFALISVLFPRDSSVNLKKAAFIALGCVLSTSGMGIFMTFAILCWYFLFNRAKKGTKLFKIMIWSPLILIGLLILLQIPFVQTAIQRVFSNVDGYNAVRGRTGQWGSAIAPMSGVTLWFGYGSSAKYPYYLTGLADTIYEFGITGALLELACFLYLMLRRFDRYVWCCSLVFLALFCVAHLTSFYSQVFYLGLVTAESLSLKRRTRR